MLALMLRWCRHIFAWRPSYTQVFSPSCLATIAQAVRRSEATHAAQICVLTEHTLPRSYLRRNAPVRQRAEMLFGKYRVWDTEGNTGVLIYINFVERAVELVADRGLVRHVPQTQWAEWAIQLQTAYAAGQFELGTVAVIESMSAVFVDVVPRVNGHVYDNAQADEPVVL